MRLQEFVILSYFAKNFVMLKTLRRLGHFELKEKKVVRLPYHSILFLSPGFVIQDSLNETLQLQSFLKLINFVKNLKISSYRWV